MIRAFVTLSACLLFAPGCGRDATPMGMDPEPGVGEPESPDPESPEPEAPQAPEPEPGLPVLPRVANAAIDGVFRGRGTTLLQMRGRHVFAGAPRVEVEIFDANDVLLGTLDAGITLKQYDVPVSPGAGATHAAYTLEEGEWLLQHYWPGTLAGVRAEATLFDGDVAVITLDEPMFAVPVVTGDFDAACDSAGFANRCPDGSACFVAPRPVQGFCRPTTVDAWLLDDGVTLDISIEDNLGSRAVFDVLIDGQIEPVEMDSDWTRRFLAPGMDAAESIDMFFNAHRVRTPVRAPEERWLGDECDSLEIANNCAAGRCGVDAICVDPATPIIEQATYNAGRVWDGAHVIGQDADGDIAALELTFIDGETRVPMTFGVRGGFSPGQPVPNWRLSLRVEDDGRFELLMDREDWGGQRFYASVEVVIVDREGLRSAPVVAGRGRPEGRGDLIGARTLCDRAQSGFWGTCEEGTVCARRDGAANYECNRIEECAEPDQYVALGDAPVTVALRDAENLTRLPCNAGGSDGGEGRFVFTAPAGALYRFTARGQSVSAIALRAQCDLSGGERGACVGAEEIQGTDEVGITQWLTEGETGYVLVEAVAYNSMVEVSVEAVE